MSFIKKALTAVSGLLLAGSVWAAQAVNINTADAAALAEALKGVGQSKAEAIVAYRTEHGPFKDADALVNVKGIGLNTVNNNRDNILVNDSQP